LRARRAILAACVIAASSLVACGKHDGASAAQRAEFAGRFASDKLPDGVMRTDVDFADEVHLVGWSVSPKQPLYPPGTRVTVTLVWRVDQRLDQGTLLFTHLVGAGGEQLENLDDKGPLRHMDGVAGQPLPPSAWEPGKFYRDELTFTIPAEPTPFVTIGAGLYKDKARLPIKGPGGDRESRASVVRLATGAKDARTAIKEMRALHLAPGEAITIDGRLDEPAWQKAESTGPFVDVGSGRENPLLPTQGSARLRWDDTHLYVGFEVSDKKVHGGWPHKLGDKPEPHLWEKDTVEIMIDPDGDGDNKDYYEIQINPQNLVFDTQYDGYNSPNGNGKGPFGHEEWSANLTSAVIVRGTLDDDGDVDQGYTVEAKIPWASFTKAEHAPPVPGSTWRMNFYAMKNNGGTAWSPILGMGNFHRASRFGRVRWVPSDSAPAPSASPTAAP
jgi:hypothetical protein